MNKNMKKVSRVVLTLTFVLGTAGTGIAAEQKGCAAKRENIERQISYAKAHGNTPRVAGLETALMQTERYCSDSQLQKERADKVREKEQKVTRRTRDLIDAQETGRQDKISRQMKKLEEAKEELAEARAAYAS
jgi:hypothetical protein